METNTNEIEMTPAELRSWIQEEVDTSDLVVLKRALLDQVQTLIKRREKQAAATQNIYSCTYESVKECESVMKELYSQLGIVYRDTDSEEEDVVSQECFINADHNEDDNTKALNNADVNSSSSGSTTAVTIAPSPAFNSSENGSPRSETDEGSSAKDSNNKKQPGGEGHAPQLPRNRRAICNSKLCVALSQGTPSGRRTSEKVVTSSDDSDWDPQTSGCEDSDSDFLESSRKAGTKYRKSRKGCPISSRKVEKNKKEPQLKKDMTSKPLSAGPPQDQEATKCGSVALTDTQDTKKEESYTTVVSSLSLPALNPDTHPPVGLEEEEVKLNMVVLARKKTRTWHQAKIVEIKTVVHGLKYKVDFGENGQRWVSGNHIAFSHTPSLPRLYVGVRVVTKCQQVTESWYSSGVLAELPNRKNRMRFLVFFDDGIPSYVGLPLLHLVCRPLKNELEDIEEEANRNFVTDYIKIYPNPPMAQYRVGQTINTEFEGVQKRCEVEQIDSSLIEILFLDDGHREWVYRGSMRLEHIANMKKRFEESKNKKDTAGPNITLGVSKQTIQSSKHSSNGTSMATTAAGSASNVAKQTGTTNSSNNDKTGTTPVSSLVKYTPHRCCRACIDHLQAKGDIKHRGRNPLLVPLLLEFRRIKGLQRIKGKTSFHVFYRAPCGLSLRTMAAVQDYLLQTCCDFVRLDMFCMDPFVSVTTTHQPLPSKIFIPDLSLGRENQPLSCINEHNNFRPPTVNYIRDRGIAKGISINNSLDFLEGCDCTDGCKDSMTCSCHQLTIQATSLHPGGPVDINAGYSHKRLEKRIPTGLYECNSLCRCNPRLCSNRVVQHGIQIRLQLFMTLGKGWGIRTLDDVAKGTFICTFAGKIKINEKKYASANVYYAKLNHIEQVEIFKENYEKEAYCSDSETDTGKDIVESIEDSSSDSGGNYKNKELLRDSGNNFNPNFSSLERSEIPHRNNKVLQDATLHSRPGVNSKQPKTAELPPVLADRTDLVTRRFFEEEECYIIDARLEGNLARYLNHSCLPNLFEQNVFVDTHDLRFPLIAYFAKKRIRAGTELTLNYSSLIGSVDGKGNAPVMHCRCGSVNCNKTLLVKL